MSQVNVNPTRDSGYVEERARWGAAPIAALIIGLAILLFLAWMAFSPGGWFTGATGYNTGTTNTNTGTTSGTTSGTTGSTSSGTTGGTTSGTTGSTGSGYP